MLGFAVFLLIGCEEVRPGQEVPMERALNEDEGEMRGNPSATYLSPCVCILAHGEWRWDIKTDPMSPPPHIPADHHLKPSDIGRWNGPGGDYDADTPRIGRENEWFVVTGRVREFRAEPDGDLHIHMEDVRRPNVKLVVEIPLGKPWCELRREAFAWTNAQFPFTRKNGREFKLTRHPVIEVTGRAFYDADHAPYGDTRLNRRPYDSKLTVWEIHPVMKMRVLW